MPNWLRSILNFESQSPKVFWNQFASCLSYWWGITYANSLIIIEILFSSPLVVSTRILGYDHELTVACSKCNLGGSWTGSMREVLHSRKTFREPHQSPTQKGKRAIELPRESRIEKGFYVCRWCHSAARWGDSWSDSINGQHQLEFFHGYRVCFIYVWQILGTISQSLQSRQA